MMGSGFRVAGSGFLVLACIACGSSSSTSPSTGTPPTSATTITISNNTVSPKTITVPRGSQVTIVNNDSQTHTMDSDPHPEHTQCPALNDVGTLAPGQSRQSGNLVTPGTCGYHDHDHFTVTSLQGTIIVQ